MKHIQSVEEFESLLEKNGTFFILKHSTTCPISQSGYEEFEEFAEKNQDVACYYLTVQNERSVSNHIAEKFSIKHESPQAIYFVNGSPSWNASHFKITSKSLTSAKVGE